MDIIECRTDLVNVRLKSMRKLSLRQKTVSRAHSHKGKKSVGGEKTQRLSEKKGMVSWTMEEKKRRKNGISRKKKATVF